MRRSLVVLVAVVVKVSLEVNGFNSCPYYSPFYKGIFLSSPAKALHSVYLKRSSSIVQTCGESHLQMTSPRDGSEQPSRPRRVWKLLRTIWYKGKATTLDEGGDEHPKRVSHLWKRIRTKVDHYWYSGKRLLPKTFTVYVLECEDNKLYVGYTTNRKQRYSQHLSGSGGSKWTKLHKPIRIVKEYRRVPKAYHLGMEAQVTAELMLEYGVNNVRGAMFVEPRTYTTDDVNALTGFLGHFNNLDYISLEERLKSELPESFMRRKKKRRKRKKKRRQKFAATDRCFYCGKVGHWAEDCPERWGSLKNEG